MTEKIDTISTKDLSLVAALTTMGITLPQRPQAITNERGNTVYTFYVSAESEDGRYRTKDLVKAWDDDEYEVENPDCPFTHIKVAFANREALLDLTKSFKQLIAVRSKGKIRLIPKGISDDDAKELFTL